MKYLNKKLLIIFFALLCVFSISILMSACNTDHKDKEISVIFDDRTFVYDGTQKSLLIDGNLPEGVSVKYYYDDELGTGKTDVGTYTVTAKFDNIPHGYKSIEDKTALLTIVKAGYNMQTVTFLNSTVTYDGMVHSLTAENLPSGVSVTYENNDKINVGKYIVTAHFCGDIKNYEPIPDQQAILEITQAQKDFSEVIFSNQTVTYDGKVHSLAVENLPAGVSVSYDNNDKTVAGTYIVTAKFDAGVNYMPLPDMQATLTIEKGVFNIDGITFHDRKVTYDGNVHSLAVENLPAILSVSYDNNDKIDVGTYVVTAKFDAGVNYMPLPDMQATLTIEKGIFATDGIAFRDRTVTYDGKVHSLAAENLPAKLSVSYDNNDKTAAGTYVVTAKFDAGVNYMPLPDMQATLTIEKSAEPLKNFVVGNKYYDKDPFFVDTESIVGIVHQNWLDDNGLEITAPISIGIYTLRIEVEESDNYLGQTKDYEVEILEDTIAPYLNDEYFMQPGQAIRATDNAKIEYWIYYAENYLGRYLYAYGSELVINTNGIFYCYAVDTSGNESNCGRISIGTGQTYQPTEVFPKNQSVITNSYVELYADMAFQYFLGTGMDNMKSLSDSFVDYLENNTQYYWYATDGVHKSRVFTFTTDYTTPTKIKCIYPADGAIISDEFIRPKATSSCPIVKYWYTRYESLRPIDDQIFNYMDPGYKIDNFKYQEKYLWYAEDANGNVSDVQSFTYMGKGGKSDAIWIVGLQDESYIDSDYLVLTIDGYAGIRYALYKKEGDNRYTSLIDGSRGHGIFADIRDIKNNDILYIYAVDYHLTYSKCYTVYVDREAPVCGIAESSEDGTVSISLGSDNFGARYYYRLNYGEWIEYTSAQTIEYESSLKLSLKAEDFAGHTVYREYQFATTAPALPEIRLLSGSFNRFTNQNVIVELIPVKGTRCYYSIDGVLYDLSQETEIAFEDEGIHELYTMTSDSEGLRCYSDPYYIKIDKTAPEVLEILCNHDDITAGEWFSLNNVYAYLVVPHEGIKDLSDVRVCYQFRDVDRNWFDLKGGRIPLYSHVVFSSDIYYVDIKFTDEAGNESIMTVPLYVDVEGPVIGNFKMESYFDETQNRMRYIANFGDITDDHGWLYHIHFQVWDQDAYENGKESIINESFYVEKGTTSYSYDFSDLPDGTTYYFLLYIVDNQINATYSTLYYFYKHEPSQEITTDDGYVFLKTGETYTLIDYKGADNLILPESFNGNEYAIIENLFRENKIITSIIIPQGVTYIGTEAFYGCDALKKVYYKGTAAEWASVSIGFRNECITSVNNLYYYSETEPVLNADGTAYDGNYWHYDKDGVTPVIWKKEN